MVHKISNWLFGFSPNLFICMGHIQLIHKSIGRTQILPAPSHILYSAHQFLYNGMHGKTQGTSLWPWGVLNETCVCCHLNLWPTAIRIKLHHFP